MKNKKGLLHHIKSIGFTNRLAIYLTILLFFGLVGGLYLSILSINYNYTGPLLCWTVVFTPLGTCLSIVLGKIVDKSRAENMSGNGDGIKFAVAMATNADQGETEMAPTMGIDYYDSENSPVI